MDKNAALTKNGTTLAGMIAGFGSEIKPGSSYKEIMTQAGLDWKVKKVDLKAMYKGQLIDTPKQALIKEDGTYFDTVSKDWHECQNDDAFSFLEEFTDATKGQMTITHAGGIDHGRLVWALASIDREFTVFGKDVIGSKILITNPHIYGKTINFVFTPMRFFCTNQLTMNLMSKGKSDLNVKLSHRTKFDPQLVKMTMGLAEDRLNDYKEMAEFLGSKRYTPETLDTYFKEALGVKAGDTTKPSKAATLAMEVMETQPGAECGEGTFWQAFNAVTYTTDHLLGRSNEGRMKSIWYGPSRKVKTDAFNKAVKYAEAAA